MYNLEITVDNRDYKIPMFLSEECRTGSLPEFPYIKMHRALARYDPHNIEASVRFMKAWIDLKFYLADTDNMTVADFKQAVLNEMQDLVRTNQSSVTGTYFMNIEDEQDTEEVRGGQVVFVYILTLKCEQHDAC